MPGERFLVTDSALADFHEPALACTAGWTRPEPAGRGPIPCERFPLAGKSFADRGPGSAEFDG
jgi:hypothetical protein